MNLRLKRRSVAQQSQKGEWAYEFGPVPARTVMTIPLYPLKQAGSNTTGQMSPEDMLTERYRYRSNKKQSTTDASKAGTAFDYFKVLKKLLHILFLHYKILSESRGKKRNSRIQGTGNFWLQRNYPKLKEYLKDHPQNVDTLKFINDKCPWTKNPPLCQVSVGGKDLKYRSYDGSCNNLKEGKQNYGRHVC